MSRGRTTLLWTSWLPLALFVAARLYVDRFEGWGQWAAAPVLLGPSFLSGAFVLAGTRVAWGERSRGRIRPGTWVALVLASIPCLWL
ncbi:MAG: hypothetical protein PVI31_09750, partial [Gemmatimonadota bacterium]